MTTAPQEPAAEWSVARALQYYGVENWGDGYFTVNEKGNLCVVPDGLPGPVIDIMDVVENVREQDLGFPCVIRFQDVLRSRVITLNETFREAIKENEYSGSYYGVYPIKVNQMREVVEEVLDAGAPYHYGLEAGSKAELLAAIALNEDREALTVCNGYKDEDFMRLALAGRQIGRQTVVVIEKLSELPLLLRVAEEMQVQPLVGLRVKLATEGVGKWESSSGPFAKFGLTAPEIIQAVRMLRDAGQEDALRLFHFHVGSQITDIHTMKEAVKEAARTYAKLRKMGLPIRYFDIGGGLGVDYVGARTASESSTNYTLKEFVSDVVYNIQQICANEEVPEPDIVSESGRAVTAHHSCIIMNVFDAIEIGPTRGPGAVGADTEEPAPGEPDFQTTGVGHDAEEFGEDVVREMREIVENLTEENPLETYHDAQAKREEALSAFRLGILGLEEQAIVENLYWGVCRRLARLALELPRPPEDLETLASELVDQYLANFSLFQSALDHWAFDQIFPVLPVHRLNEPPTREATLADITCDSDGKVDKFVTEDGVQSRVALHALRNGEPYYIGMFLTGAYQDIMGDMHNLFGRANEVHVFVDDEDPEDFYVETVVPGDIVADVLARVQYEPRELVKKVKTAADQRVREGKLKPKEGVALVDYVENVMKGYTYLISTNPTGFERLNPRAVEALKKASPER